MNIIQTVQKIVFGQETDNHESFEQELAFIRDVVGLLDETMIEMNPGDHQDGWLDDFWIDLYKLSPRGYAPVYMIYVDNNYFETIDKAVQHMVNNLQF